LTHNLDLRTKIEQAKSFTNPMDKWFCLSSLLETFPDHVGLIYQLGAIHAHFLDYQGTIDLWMKALSFCPENLVLKSDVNSLIVFWENEKLNILNRENEVIDDDKIYHVWKSIKPLPEDLLQFKHPDVDVLRDFWMLLDEDKLEKLKRHWVIETGVIENTYYFEEDLRKLLVKSGFSYVPQVESIIPIGRQRVVQILESQNDVLKLIMDLVSNNYKELTIPLIIDIHDKFISKYPFHLLMNKEGEEGKVYLIRHGFKVFPNNPIRKDGKVHQYCPPSKVEEEIQKLLDLYNQYHQQGICPIVLSAWLHHRFIQIQPFQDGNGRVARAISSIPLLFSHLPPFLVTNVKKVEYFTALQAADQDDNLLPLIEFIVTSIKEASDFLISLDKVEEVEDEYI